MFWSIVFVCIFSFSPPISLWTLCCLLLPPRPSPPWSKSANWPSTCMLFTYLMDLIYLNHRYFWLACLSVPRLSLVFEYVVEACLCSIIDAFLQDICLTVLAWIRSQRKVRRLVYIYTWKPFYMLGCTLLLYLRVSLGRAFLLHQHYLWKIPQRQQQFPVKFSLHRVEYLLIRGTLVCVCVWNAGIDSL